MRRTMITGCGCLMYHYKRQGRPDALAWLLSHNDQEELTTDRFWAVKALALAFFQLEMQGGIFQSCWSFTVSGRGGECMTGTGGEPGPRGTLMCLQTGPRNHRHATKKAPTTQAAALSRLHRVAPTFFAWPA